MATTSPGQSHTGPWEEPSSASEKRTSPWCGGPRKLGSLPTRTLRFSAPSSVFCTKATPFWENSQAPKQVLRASASGQVSHPGDVAAVRQGLLRSQHARTLVGRADETSLCTWGEALLWGKRRQDRRKARTQAGPQVGGSGLR